MIYVTSDIHGDYNSYMELLKAIDLTSDDKLIIAGDIIDRGNGGLRILNHIRTQPNIELLLGNHEHMLLLYDKFNDNGTLKMWLNVGGRPTYNEFYYKLNQQQRDDIINYLEGRKLYKIIGKNIISHAGLSVFDKNMPIQDLMSQQSAEDLLWSREDFYLGPSPKGYTVIFGHTPVPYIRLNQGELMGSVYNGKPFTIWHGPGKICVDCGCGSKAGRLACIRLDDMVEFYV